MGIFSKKWVISRKYRLIDVELGHRLLEKLVDKLNEYDLDIFRVEETYDGKIRVWYYATNEEDAGIQAYINGIWINELKTKKKEGI